MGSTSGGNIGGDYVELVKSLNGTLEGFQVGIGLEGDGIYMSTSSFLSVMYISGFTFVCAKQGS